MKGLYHSREVKTIGAAFRAYCTELAHQIEIKQLSANAVSLARTALLGYTVPAWGGPVRQGNRMTLAEIEAALSFLDTLPLEQLSQAPQVQEQYFNDLKIHSQKQKTNRYQLTRFMVWVDEQSWLEVKKSDSADSARSKTGSSVYRHSSNAAKLQGKPDLKNLALTKRVRRQDFGLKPDEMNATLQAQMDELAQFEQLYLNHRPATIASNASFLSRMLGWLHHYQKASLDGLSLTSLVPYTRLKVSLETIQAECSNEEEAWQKLLMRREQRKEIAEQQARTFESLWDDYFVFYQDAPHTQVATIQALIIIAKYFYRQDTENTASKSGYTDIPVVRRLRQKLSAVNKLRKSKPKQIPYKERSISWEAVLDVLRTQQVKYEEQFYYAEGQFKGKPHKQKQARSPKTIARDLQLLLALCFFTVIPPVRNRTICELELGRTVIKGTIEDGVLIPIENMSRPELAQWHLHLDPNDYKTGAIYGSYDSLIEDVELANGVTFYELLQTWIEIYRPLFEPDHDRLFIKTRNTMGATPGEPITHRNLTAWIKYLFYKHAGVPVVPQSLRKMYITHLKNCNASEAELEAAARAMHHSRAMQSSEYDEQDLRDKIAPISALNQQLFKKTFQRQEIQPLPLMSDGRISVRDLSNQQLKVLLQDLRQEHKRRKDQENAS